MESADRGPILEGVGRTARYIGLVVLAGAAWFLVAGEVGWISHDVADTWFRPFAGAGAALFGAGFLLGALGTTLHWLTRKRCVRCGARTERGQTYCLDHLRATVHEAQDTTHRQTLRRQR